LAAKAKLAWLSPSAGPSTILVCGAALSVGGESVLDVDVGVGEGLEGSTVGSGVRACPEALSGGAVSSLGAFVVRSPNDGEALTVVSVESGSSLGTAVTVPPGSSSASTIDTTTAATPRTTTAAATSVRDRFHGRRSAR
jgi:hypothetical protein